MKPLEILGRAFTSEGNELVLYRREDHYQIRVDGLELMANRGTESEKALAQRVCDRLTGARPRLLIGGLGMGFTLRAALDRLPAVAEVVVAELLPQVVDWNRGPISHLADHPLEDPRVEVRVDDVAKVIRRYADLDLAENCLDGILLDVDNGPKGLVRQSNDRLYLPAGLDTCRRALKTGGYLAVWSSFHEAWFQERLADVGFQVERQTVKAQGGIGPDHFLYLARA